MVCHAYVQPHAMRCRFPCSQPHTKACFTMKAIVMTKGREGMNQHTRKCTQRGEEWHQVSMVAQKEPLSNQTKSQHRRRGKVVGKGEGKAAETPAALFPKKGRNQPVPTTKETEKQAHATQVMVAGRLMATGKAHTH